MELVTGRGCMMTLVMPVWFHKNLGALGIAQLVGWRIHPCAGRVVHLCTQEQKLLCLGSLKTSACVFLHLAVRLSCIMLFVISVNVSYVLAEFCELLQNYRTWGGVIGTLPQFVANSDRSLGNLETRYLHLVSEGGGRVVGLSPSPAGLC